MSWAHAADRRLPLAMPAAVLFGVLGHLYGLWILVATIDATRSMSLSLAVFASSLGLLAATILLTRTNGTLAVGRLYALGIGIVLIDVANALLIDTDKWTETLLWSAGTGGVLLVVFGLVAPVGHVAVLTAAHGLTLFLCLLLIPLEVADQAARAGLTAVDALVVPALGVWGAGIYRHALTVRADAMSRADWTEQAIGEGDAAEQLALEELSWLSEQVAPLLELQADGGELSRADRLLLDRSAVRLRRELTAHPGRPGLAGVLPRRAPVDLELIDPDQLGHRFKRGDRAALVGLLRLVAAGSSGRAGPPGSARAVITEVDGRAHVTLYARGLAADSLHGEHALTLLDQLGAGLPERVGDGAIVELELPLSGAAPVDVPGSDRFAP